MPNLKPLQIINPKETYSLKNADRELSLEEIEAEDKAEKFSVKGFRRIKPVPGTLGFMLRNFADGDIGKRNESVIQFLKWSQQSENGSQGKVKFVKNFLILWENMDEFSKRRVDIFDILCQKYGVQLKKFWGVLQEGLFDFNDIITQTAISGKKPEFIEILSKMMSRDKGTADRRLFAEAAKLITNEPLVKIEDKSQHLTVNSQMPSFLSSVKRADNIKHEDIEIPNRQLTEGDTEFIDAEFEEVREKELVERR
jgi:hypothetical protein